MSTETATNVCPANNFCERTMAGAAPCGRDPRHFSPMLLPGQYCPTALEGRLAWEYKNPGMAQFPDQYAPIQLFRIAGLEAQRALSLPAGSVVSASHFEAAQTIAQGVEGRRDRGALTGILAARLLLYLPALQAEHSGASVTADDEAAITAGLGRLLEAASDPAVPLHNSSNKQWQKAHFLAPEHQPCFTDLSSKNRCLAKLAVELLFRRPPARGRIRPALTTELPSTATGFLSSVHTPGYDFHRLDESASKLPVLTYPLKQGGDRSPCPVTYLEFPLLVKQAIGEVDGSLLTNYSEQDLTHQILMAISREAQGFVLPHAGSEILNLMADLAEQQMITQQQHARS